jgi:hypothetical protein
MTALAPSNTRDKTAARLLGSSSKNSYDPLLDIDWDAPVVEDLAYLPFERVSLYGTAMWDEMTPEQRIALSKHELASVASTGLWFEIILIQMLTRYVYHQDPQAAHTHYALTEIGDETRHSTMFSLMLDKLDRGPYPFNPLDRFATDLLRAFSTEPLAYVAVLFVEEMFDALQRYGLKDDTVQPLCRQTFRIHVVEEARHMRFARDELFRLIPRLPRVRREGLAAAVAVGVGLVSRSMRTPQMYADAGLDVREAMRAARSNREGRAVLQECIDRFTPVYDELGLITPASRALWRAQGWRV